LTPLKTYNLLFKKERWKIKGVISIYKWQQVKALKVEGRLENRKSLDDRIIKILKIN